MLYLPKSTEFNKRIPKQKFYEKLSVKPALKKLFVDQIQAIYWRNKVASTTTNIEAGQSVTEIEVFEIKLCENTLDEAVIRSIDNEIPYHILFLLEFNGQYQAWIAYKETTSKADAFNVCDYYHTDWMTEQDLPLKLDGMNLDVVYENFVRQIAGDILAKRHEQETLAESVEREEHRQQLRKQIAALETKIHREKQLNRQVQLNGELKALKRELECL